MSAVRTVSDAAIATWHPSLPLETATKKVEYPPYVEQFVRFGLCYEFTLYELCLGELYVEMMIWKSKVIFN